MRKGVTSQLLNEVLRENEKLREALELLVEVPREGQELTWEQRARNVIIRQALGQQEEKYCGEGN